MRTTGGSGGVVSTVGAGASVGGERLRTGGRGVVAASSSSEAILGGVGQRSSSEQPACEALCVDTLGLQVGARVTFGSLLVQRGQWDSYRGKKIVLS